MTLKLDISKSRVKQITSKYKSLKTPGFVDVNKSTDIDRIISIAKRYRHYKKIILIGNGGSITSFWTYYKALPHDRKAYLLNTMDPDLIAGVKKKCYKNDTLVVVISKSGNTVGVIEDLLQFIDYKMLVITEGGALEEIALKRHFDLIEHPDVGGRFCGSSIVAYIPAAICGIDIKSIDKGIKAMYGKCAAQNSPAKKISSVFYQLSKKGYTEIFMPVYSPKLEGFINLAVQLIHESCGKKGKGMTIYGSLAPESQHHTNQRFFGGKANVIGLFVSIDKFHHMIKTDVPKDLKDVNLRYGRLDDIDNIELGKCVVYEFTGTYIDAVEKKIPLISLRLDMVDGESVGELVALFQYISVEFSSLLDVNPFDQPEVEKSKAISFDLRKKHKR